MRVKFIRCEIHYFVGLIEPNLISIIIKNNIEFEIKNFITIDSNSPRPFVLQVRHTADRIIVSLEPDSGHKGSTLHVEPVGVSVKFGHFRVRRGIFQTRAGSHDEIYVVVVLCGPEVEGVLDVDALVHDAVSEIQRCLAFLNF